MKRHLAFGVLASALLLTANSNAMAPIAQPNLANGVLPDHTDPANAAQQISLADYQTRLHTLEDLVVACQQAMSPATCQSDKVGPDVGVALPLGTREIRFGWLRNLLDQAAHPNSTPDQDTNAAKSVIPKPVPRPTPPSRQEAPPEMPQHNPAAPSPEEVIGLSSTPNIFKQLESARRRIAQDRAWATDYLASATNSAAGHDTSATSTDRHRALTSILAAKEYHAATTGPTIKDRIVEKIANWIDTVVGELMKAGAKSKWIGVTAEVGFIALLCVGLVWLLIHLERQGRLSSTMIRPDGSSGAASGRDWRLWADDAHAAAQRKAWREAIHYLYWSSISRLESSGMWPADRARTPREYLALLSKDNGLHTGLRDLTRSFERTWYAGREAGESDFQQAEQLSSSLIPGKPGRASAQTQASSGEAIEAGPSLQ